MNKYNLIIIKNLSKDKIKLILKKLNKFFIKIFFYNNIIR